MSMSMWIRHSCGSTAVVNSKEELDKCKCPGLCKLDKATWTIVGPLQEPEVPA